MEIESQVQIIKKLSLSMFRKNFFGIFHGSVSAKLAQNKFLINKKNAIFDSIERENLVVLYDKKDYRWNESSIDSEIHLNIYKNIFEAKYVVFAMSPYTISYSLDHSYIMPKDFFGKEKIGKVKIYDPKNFDDWYERAPYEVYNYMLNEKTNLMVIRGYGVVAYNRVAEDLVKDIALLDNSCKILQYQKIYN